jgi:hypothetical protein
VHPEIKVHLDHQALDCPVLQDQQVQPEIRALRVRLEILALLELLAHQVRLGFDLRKNLWQLALFSI